MEVMLVKSTGGAMIPMDDGESDKLRRIKHGSVVKCSVTEMRNGAYFRKWWSLAKMAFDMASERMQPREHRGMQVMPNFEEFRKDLTILAGYYDVVYKYDGTMRLKAKSLKWSEMNEETFDRLFSETINVILQKVIPGVTDEHTLREAVERTLHYA